MDGAAWGRVPGVDNQIHAALELQKNILQPLERGGPGPFYARGVHGTAHLDRDGLQEWGVGKAHGNRPASASLHHEG